jgi:hypothetical protein
VNVARPIVEEVLRFEDLPVGALASRRAVVRWSDGAVGECARWYGDEVMLSEGDLLGKTREQIRALHFHRDRDWLRS